MTRQTALPLALILLLFTALTLYQSATLPLGEAADETDHFQYHQFVARNGHPPLTAEQRDEAGFKGGLAPLYYWLTAWPIALIGQQNDDTQPRLRRLDERPQRHIPNDGLGFNRILHTMDEVWLWQGEVLVWHLVRLFSLVMSWGTLLGIFFIARAIWPDQPLAAVLATGFVAFLPRFVMSAAVINDDNLVFLWLTLICLVQIYILRGNEGAYLFALWGGLFGLALITKYFALILLFEIVLVLWLIRGRWGWRELGGFLSALALTAGPWFAFIVLRFNRVTELGWLAGLAASLGEPQITEGLVSLMSGTSVRPPSTTYPLGEWLGLLYQSFWFEYGWMNIFAPTWVYWVLSGWVGLAILGWVNAHSRKPLQSVQPQITLLLALRLGLFFTVVLGRYVLSATIDTGQGRHLYPALPTLAILIGGGWFWLGRKNITYLPTLLLSGYALFSSYLLLNPAYVQSHYETLPIERLSDSTIERFSNEESLNRRIAESLNLVRVASAGQVRAGEVLPVMLAWHTTDELTTDYLLGLCLVADASTTPVGCWYGHFVNGHYPTRAWEAGDFVRDTVEILLADCATVSSEPHQLWLRVWEQSADRLAPDFTAEPRFNETFSAPRIMVQPSREDGIRGLQVWPDNSNHPLSLNETVSVRVHPSQDLTFLQSLSGLAWQPSLPKGQPLCDGATTLYPFTVLPETQTGDYQLSLESAQTVSVLTRNRQFEPIPDHAISFDGRLIPRTMQVAEVEIQHDETVPRLSLNFKPPQPIPVTIGWHNQRWHSERLIVSLKLLDKDFVVGWERVAQLGNRYSNVLWTPGELITETYPVALQADVPAGLYQLELSMVRQDESLPDGFEYLPLTDRDAHNLYPVQIRLLDTLHGRSPSQTVDGRIGEQIQLIGFDVTMTDQQVDVALHWHNLAKIEQELTVFTQLLGPDGQVWAQWDNPPQAGRYPTSAWQVQDLVVDRYQLTLPKDAPAGDYQLLVGMYDPLTVTRWPAYLDQQRQTNDAVPLAIITHP